MLLLKKCRNLKKKIEMEMSAFSLMLFMNLFSVKKGAMREIFSFKNVLNEHQYVF